ncbi:MAG: D-lyxose/D-mannose family sugar isomerase [Lachnospiraceae bacterium]|nr:D-lyxose/D-mannose family sugar isomerase [Lachnospiraceae bacterium]
MKRSEINKIIEEAIAFTEEKGLVFPPFAKWKPEVWTSLGEESRELADNMLGWDVTDFGSGDFKTCGLLVFTFRNGNFNRKDLYPKPYAEKLLLVEDGQELPYHFHWSKMEDIINRGGGNLILQLYNSDEQEQFANTDVTVKIDGRRVTIPAGGCVTLHPGESITLSPGQYHRWQGEKGSGKVMLFEVSTTNDDMIDNRFLEAKDRIPVLEEDEEPRHLIFKDYVKYVRGL